MLLSCCREDQGVKVRVELGPRDAQARKACLALCRKPGEVADKSFLQVGKNASGFAACLWAALDWLLPGTAAGSRCVCKGDTQPVQHT